MQIDALPGCPTFGKYVFKESMEEKRKKLFSDMEG